MVMEFYLCLCNHQVCPLIRRHLDIITRSVAWFRIKKKTFMEINEEDLETRHVSVALKITLFFKFTVEGHAFSFSKSVLTI